MSALQKNILKSKLPPLPSKNTDFGPRKGGGPRKRDYTPISWDTYFDEAKDIAISEGNVFRVYTLGSSGPLLLLLHGGGYCGLTWSLFAASISSMVECQVAAIDLRGHGETITFDSDDLSADTLSNDVGEVIKCLYSSQEAPPIVVIGHSMGGAVAVHTAHKQLIPSCIGLIVIDVVEGTAMDALQSMQSFLRSRPNSFQSLERAIEWCVRSGQVRNVESARVSMPGQLKSSMTDQPATAEVCDSNSKTGATLLRSDSIPEEEEEDDFQNGEAPHKKKAQDCEFLAPLSPVRSTKYTWRIDLPKTERYWSGWFDGLSSLFLATNEPKLLLLAGVDRLDRDLTIGQMQGKFQMQVLPQCGHAVHEDVPDKVAEAIATFLVRHKFATSTSEFTR